MGREGEIASGEGRARSGVRSRRQRIAHALVNTDRAALRWGAPLRTALVAGLTVLAALVAVGPSFALPVGLGAFFVGLADQRGDFADRLRGMVLATILLVLTTAIGLAVSPLLPLHLVAAGLVAGFLGYIGLAGPRAAMAGVVSLVNFTVFAGTPEPVSAIGPAALGVLAGCTFQIAAMALPLLTRRIGGLRTDISVAIRAEAFALTGEEGATSTDPLAKLAVARRLIGSSGVLGRTKEWCVELVEQTDRIRFAFIALEGGRQMGEWTSEGMEASRQLERASSDLLLATATALEFPATRGRIDPLLERFEAAFRSAGEVLPASSGRPLEMAGMAVRRLTGLVRGEWPIGPRRAEVQFGPQVNFDWARKLVGVRDPDRLFTRHAIRLAALIVIATAIAEYLPSTHTYWLPLTVAWVTKPDLAGTAERVLSRIVGTMLGLAVFGTIALTVGPDQPVMLILYSVGVLFAVAWLPANYAVCVAGWTPAVLALISLGFPEVTELIGPRLIETIFGGALVIAVATIWPTRLTHQLARRLASTARALREYGRAIESGGRAEREEGRDALITERMQSGVLVAAAAHEPPVPGKGLAYEQAQEVLDNLVDAVALAVAVDQSRDGEADAPIEAKQITEQSLRRLDQLADHLEASEREPEPAETPGGYIPDEPPATRFERLVEEAHRAIGSVRTGGSGIG